MPETNGTSNRIEDILIALEDMSTKFAAVYNSSMVALDVAIQDQHTEPISIFASRKLSTSNLTSALTVDDNVITISSGHTATTNDHLEIQEGGRYLQASITSKTSVDLTVDMPTCCAFTTEAEVRITNIHMNVDGSTADIEFSLYPPTGSTYDISRAIISIVDGTAMDDGKYGGIAALTNGTLFRQINGETYNLFVARTNGDFVSEAYDVTYSDKAPGGENGMRCRRSWNGQSKTGVTLRLSGNTGDHISVKVRDATTANTDMTCKFQGHMTQGG